MTQQDETRLGEINALLGRGTEYEGKLCFEGRVRIDGRFRGEIHSDDLLILGDGSDVDGTLHVGKLIVRGGVLRGKVFAAQLVELFAPARVHADIETPLFFVDRGVHFDGRCSMGADTTTPLPIDGVVSARLAERAVASASPNTDASATAGEPDDSSGEVANSDDEPTQEVDESAPGDPDADPKPKRRRTRKSRA